MAHSDEAMTHLYQSGHPLPWTTVEIRAKGIGFRDREPRREPETGKGVASH
jgi:hypothetical protein